MNKPLVLGHRGYRKKFPENTLLAFDKAFEFGADGIECDVQKSSDGIYFIFHDHDLERMTGFGGLINKTNSQKIRSLNAGKKQRVPDFDEFLDSMPKSKFINIELKEETLTVDDSCYIIEKLKTRSMIDNVLISSFMHELLPPFREAGFMTGLLFETETLTEKTYMSVFNLFRYRPWSVNIPVNLFTGELSFLLKIFLFAARFLRIKFIFWTVNEAEQYNAVKKIAHAVITDDVELILKLRDKD